MDAAPVREAILQTLNRRTATGGIVERVDPRIRELEQLPPRSVRAALGRKSSTVFTMNGVRFHYDGARRPEDRSLSRSARKLRRRRPVRPRRSPRRFLLPGRIRAAPLPPRTVRASPAWTVRVPRWKWPTRTPTLNGRELDWIEANAFDLLREYAAAEPPLRHHRSRSAGLRQNQARPRKGPARLQGTQPARPENAAARRDSRDLLLLLPRQRAEFPGNAWPTPPAMPTKTLRVVESPRSRPKTTQSC